MVPLILERCIVLTWVLILNQMKCIVSIIPEIVREFPEVSDRPKINLQENIQTLFANYFTHRRGQAPHEELMELLKEVIVSEENWIP